MQEKKRGRRCTKCRINRFWSYSSNWRNGSLKRRDIDEWWFWKNFNPPWAKVFFSGFFLSGVNRGEFSQRNSRRLRFFQLVIKTYHHRELSSRGGDSSESQRVATVKSSIFIRDLSNQPPLVAPTAEKNGRRSRLFASNAPRLCCAKRVRVSTRCNEPPSRCCNVILPKVQGFFTGLHATLKARYNRRFLKVPSGGIVKRRDFRGWDNGTKLDHFEKDAKELGESRETNWRF